MKNENICSGPIVIGPVVLPLSDDVAVTVKCILFPKPKMNHRKVDGFPGSIRRVSTVAHERLKGKNPPLTEHVIEIFVSILVVETVTFTLGPPVIESI